MLKVSAVVIPIEMNLRWLFFKTRADKLWKLMKTVIRQRGYMLWTQEYLWYKGWDEFQIITIHNVSSLAHSSVD